MSPEARLIDWFKGETEREGQSSARSFTTGNRSMVLRQAFKESHDDKPKVTGSKVRIVAPRALHHEITHRQSSGMAVCKFQEVIGVSGSGGHIQLPSSPC